MKSRKIKLNSDNKSEKIGYRIKEALKLKGETQKKLAQYLDLSEDTIVNYVKGRTKADFETLLKIAKFSDVNQEWLLTGEGEPLLLEKSTIKEEAGRHEPTASGELAQAVENLIRKIGSLPMRRQMQGGVEVVDREQAIEAILSTLHYLDTSELEKIFLVVRGIIGERKRAEQDAPRQTKT